MLCFHYFLFIQAFFTCLSDNVGQSLETPALTSIFSRKKMKTNDEIFFLHLGFCYRELKKEQRKSNRDLGTLQSAFTEKKNKLLACISIEILILFDNYLPNIYI